MWTGDKVVETYAVQRRPRGERWSLEELMKIDATPWQWEPAMERRRAEPTVVGGGKAAHGQDAEEEASRLPHLR